MDWYEKKPCVQLICLKMMQQKAGQIWLVSSYFSLKSVFHSRMTLRLPASGRGCMEDPAMAKGGSEGDGGRNGQKQAETS